MQNKKSKPDAKRKSLYPTDNKMYGMFSIIILVIIIITIGFFRFFTTSLSEIVISDSIGLLSGVISGVLSGLLASVIVAWLLDLAECKRKNNTLQKTITTDLSDLKMWLDNLFQEMRDNLPSQNNQSGLKFDALFKLFIEQYKTNKSFEILGDSFIGIYVHINMILTVIDKLTTGEEKQYLLTVYDDAYPFLILGKSISDLRENIFNNGSYNYDFIYSGIYDFLSTVLLYVDLLSKEYSVTQVQQKRNVKSDIGTISQKN